MYCDKYRCNRKFLNSFIEEGNYTVTTTSPEGLELASGTNKITKEVKCGKLWRYAIETKLTPVDSEIEQISTTYYYANGKFIVENADGKVIQRSRWVRTRTGICASGKIKRSAFPLKGISSLKTTKSSEDGLTTYTGVESDSSSGVCAPKYIIISKKLLE